MKIENIDMKLYGNLACTIQAKCDCGKNITQGDQNDYIDLPYQYLLQCVECGRTYGICIETNIKPKITKQTYFGQNLEKIEVDKKFEEWLESIEGERH